MTHLYYFLLFGLLEVKIPHSTEYYICFSPLDGSCHLHLPQFFLNVSFLGPRQIFQPLRPGRIIHFSFFFPPLFSFYCHLLLVILTLFYPKYSSNSSTKKIVYFFLKKCTFLNQTQCTREVLESFSAFPRQLESYSR